MNQSFKGPCNEYHIYLNTTSLDVRCEPQFEKEKI